MFPNTVLTPSQIQDLVVMADRPLPVTPMLDLVLPPAKWKMHRSDVVVVNLKTREIAAIPVTQYGSAAYVNESFGLDERIYKPRSISQVNVLPGNVMLDMATREPNFRNEEIAEILADHRDIARLTREAMICLAVRGTFTYPVNTQAGVIAATQTAMGSVATPTVTGHLLNSSGANFADLEVVWRLFKDSIRAATNNAYGNDDSSLVMIVGDDVWSAIMPLLTAQFSGSGTALIEPAMRTRELNFGGMRIKNIGGTFTTYSGTTVSTAAKVEAKKAIMIDLNARHFGRWCALEQTGTPMELFVRQWENMNPYGLNILSEQKPFIFPDVRAIAIQTVLE